jgi:hypothetical protein
VRRLFQWCVFGALGAAAAAHDIPADVTAQVFLKPSGNRLELLVRVPLKAIRDVEFPARPNGFLDTDALYPWLADAATLWIAQPVEIYEDGARLPKPAVIATQLSLESDRSFASFETARAHVTGAKLPAGAHVFWNQVMLDALFEYPIRSDRSAFSIRPGLQRLAARVVTVLRFLPPQGEMRAFEFADDPGRFALDPGRLEAAGRFIELGFLRILAGADYLLFLLCLVIPVRRLRQLVLPVTAFTLTHSLTLIASAYGLGPDVLWFPPLIETLIAVSIVYLALENIVGGAVAARRWMIAFGFGLVHGFSFSFALRDMLQFAGSHRLTSVVAFNVGLELAQLLVLALIVPMLAALFRYAVAERMGIIILSALAAHTAWHWMMDRWDRLRQFRFAWPAITAALLAAAMRWALMILLLAAALWLLFRRTRYSSSNDSHGSHSPDSRGQAAARPQL